MRVPIAVFAGSEDWLTVPEDVNALLPILPNIVANRVIDGWSHSDFMHALNAPSVLYNEIIDMIEKAEKTLAITISSR